jgi:integrase
MAPRADRLLVGITRVHPHTRRRLRTPADLAACKNWVWRVRAKRKGAGTFDQLYPQNIRETTRAALDHLQQVRAEAINDLLRDAARGQAGIFKNDIPRYLVRRASVTDYQMRAYNLGLWENWLRGKLGASFLTSKITPALVELALEDWKHEMLFRKKRQQRRWASATLRTRALHLSNLFVVLYPHLPNPVLAIKDRLPPKSPAVEKAQPMSVVMALLEALRTPTVTQKRQHPTFMSVRTTVLAFAGITLQELWSIRDARAFDLRAGVLRIPAKRVVERYTTRDGHAVVRVETRREQAREVKLGPEAMEACRQYLAYPESYGSITRIKFGYFSPAGFRNILREASRSAGLDYEVSPFDFGTERAPNLDDCRGLIRAMRPDTLPYRQTSDRTRTMHAFIRASVLAHTGARVGEIALLEPKDIRLDERVVMMPTEKHHVNSGRMEKVVSRRRIPLNQYGVAALTMFIKHDLFDRLEDRSRVPDETLVPWYQQLYYQIKFAARRVKDPYTGEPLYFTPHCFRHSFATALAPLIGGDAKTGAKIMGHSAQTFMRYVRANDETARAAVEKMAEGLPVLGEPVSEPGPAAPLRVVSGGKR